MTPFRTEHLANGVEVAFTDLSNRYYGDYHRVCVEVRIMAPCPPGHGGPAVSDRLLTIKRLERMAVPGAQVAAVRDRLVDHFWVHAAGYLAHSEFPARLAARSAGLPRRQTIPGQ